MPLSILLPLQHSFARTMRANGSNDGFWNLLRVFKNSAIKHLIHSPFHESETQSNCWMTIIAEALQSQKREKKIIKLNKCQARGEWGAQNEQISRWNLKRLLKLNEFVTLMELINCFLAQLLMSRPNELLRHFCDLIINWSFIKTPTKLLFDY